MAIFDQRHRETVVRILEAIAVVEHNPARALVALEDASVAVAGGLSFGLTMPRVAALVDETMRELAAEDEHAVARFEDEGGPSA